MELDLIYKKVYDIDWKHVSYIKNKNNDKSENKEKELIF